MASSTLTNVHALYADFFLRGVRYFFPACRIEPAGDEPVPPAALEIELLGARYRFQNGDSPPTKGQMRLLDSIGRVLSARYQSIFEGVSPEATTLLFRGLSEDRYVAEFLGDGSSPEVIAEAIAVLRESSLITYENRRISTGVLLADESGRACPECLP